MFSISLGFCECTLSSASEMSDSGFSSSASTLIIDEVSRKRQRIKDAHDAVSAKQVTALYTALKFLHYESIVVYQNILQSHLFVICQFIEAVLRGQSGGEDVLQEYLTTETLTDATRRQSVNILAAQTIDEHGYVNCNVYLYQKLNGYCINVNYSISISSQTPPH